MAETDYITEDFYFFCRILEVRGTIDGDLVGVASEVTIAPSAVVTGDLWIAGGRATISGTMGDDIRFIGLTVTLADKARFTNERTDLAAGALNTTISEHVALPGDLLVYGYQAKIYGTVGGDVDFSGEALTINGVVMGRVDATVGDTRRNNDLPSLPIYDVSFSNPGMRIGDEAVIEGALAYESASRTTIPAGVVHGPILFEQNLSQADITKAEQPDVAARIMRSYFTSSLRDVFTLLLIGAVALRFVPNVVRQPAQYVRRRTIPTVGWGLIAFMLSFPLAILLILFSLLIILIMVLLALTELTIITGVGLVALNLALIGGFWFLMLFMGRVVVSYAIGHIVYKYLLRLPEMGAFRQWLIVLAMGVVLYSLLIHVPLPAFGLTIELVTVLAGIGAVTMYGRVALDNLPLLLAPRSQAAVPAGVPVRPRVPVMPAVPLGPLPPGMDNLPEGFTGFDEDW